MKKNEEKRKFTLVEVSQDLKITTKEIDIKELQKKVRKAIK